MRHRSAMQVLGCLRRHLGEEVNILQVCSEIDLSYQPTYFHVRELEELGVIQTRKQGREVLCSLRAGPAACLWLGLADEWEQRQASPPLPTPATLELVSVARSLVGEPLLFIAFEGGAAPEWGIVGLPEIDDRALVALRNASRPRAGSPRRWFAWDRDALQQALLEPDWRHRLTQSCLVAYGHERFWEWMLEAESAPAPPQSAPIAAPEEEEATVIEFLD